MNIEMLRCLDGKKCDKDHNGVSALQLLKTVRM